MFFFTQKYKNQSVRPVTSRQIQQAVQKQQEDMLLIDGEDVSALRERVCIHRFIILRLHWDVPGQHGLITVLENRWLAFTLELRNRARTTNEKAETYVTLLNNGGRAGPQKSCVRLAPAYSVYSIVAFF